MCLNSLEIDVLHRELRPSFPTIIYRMWTRSIRLLLAALRYGLDFACVITTSLSRRLGRTGIRYSALHVPFSPHNLDRTGILPHCQGITLLGIIMRLGTSSVKRYFQQ